MTMTMLPMNAAVNADSLANSNLLVTMAPDISSHGLPKADGVQSFFGTGRVTRGIDVEDRYCFLPGQA